MFACKLPQFPSLFSYKTLSVQKMFLFFGIIEQFDPARFSSPIFVKNILSACLDKLSALFQ